MSEETANTPNLEEWAMVRIKQHLAEAQRLSQVVLDFRRSAGKAEDLEFLETLAGGRIDLKDLIGEQPVILPKIKTGRGAEVSDTDDLEKIRDRIRQNLVDSKDNTRASKYDIVLQQWLRTPNKGFNNKEFHSFVEKLVPECDVLSKATTYLWNLKNKRGVVVEHKGKNYLKGANLP